MSKRHSPVSFSIRLFCECIMDSNPATVLAAEPNVLALTLIRRHYYGEVIVNNLMNKLLKVKKEYKPFHSTIDVHASADDERVKYECFEGIVPNRFMCEESFKTSIVYPLNEPISQRFRILFRPNFERNY